MKEDKRKRNRRRRRRNSRRWKGMTKRRGKLIKHHAMKTYRGVAVQFHTILTSVLGDERDKGK
jgi:hypothetical protein